MPAGRLLQQLGRMAPMAAAVASQRRTAPVARRPAMPQHQLGPPRSGQQPDPELFAYLQQQIGNALVAESMTDDADSAPGTAVAKPAPAIAVAEPAPVVAASRGRNALAGADTEELLGAAFGRTPSNEAAAEQVRGMSRRELFALAGAGMLTDGVVEAAFGSEAGISHKTSKAMARGMAVVEAADYALPPTHFGGA